jgi:hypothetical protein
MAVGVTDRLRDFMYEKFIVNVMPPKDELGIVWHYTNAAGALGIIESGTLWATSAAMLNDTDEFNHGMRLVDEIWAGQRDRSNYLDIIDSWLRIARSKLDFFHRADSYVVCASRVGNSYGQFKDYGEYALGLSSFTPLEKVVAPVIPPGVVPLRAAFELGWRTVLYDDETKKEHVVKLLGELSELASIEALGHQDEVHLAALECVFRSVAYMKAEEFAQEQEVRLCGQGMLTNAEVNFRTNEYGITPFIKIRTSADFPNDRLPLTQIKLGPRIRYPDSAETGLRIALREHKFDEGMTIQRVTGTGR